MSDALLRAFCEDGFVLLDDFLDRTLLAAISDEWQRFMATSRDDFLPADAPAAVFWRHVAGEKKRMRPLSEFRALSELALGSAASELARELAHASLGQRELRLLETIVFSKPPQESGQLSWHQDTAYFPFEPQNQIALWIPLDRVDAENGTLEYASGTHRLGLTCPVDLHTGERIGEVPHPSVPTNPSAAGHEVRVVELDVGGLAAHDGRTWHRSLPNASTDRARRAISLRYLVGATRFVPRAGNAASMKYQAAVPAGELITGPAFPLV